MKSREEKAVDALNNVLADIDLDDIELIKKLKQLSKKFPEFMMIYIEIADCYLRMNDIDNARKTYQEIIDKKDKFEDIWENELGKAFLYTNNIDKAIECFNEFELHGYSYDKEFYHSLAYLKKGDKKNFEHHFDKWINTNLEASFAQDYYQTDISALLNEEEKKLLNEKWDYYCEKYSNMEPYELYLELYKQKYEKDKSEKIELFLDDDEIYDDDFDDFEKPPAKLSRFQFEMLKSEYLSLDRKRKRRKISDKDFERWDELNELLFADVIFNR